MGLANRTSDFYFYFSFSFYFSPFYLKLSSAVRAEEMLVLLVFSPSGTPRFPPVTSPCRCLGEPDILRLSAGYVLGEYAKETVSQDWIGKQLEPIECRNIGYEVHYRKNDKQEIGETVRTVPAVHKLGKLLESSHGLSAAVISVIHCYWYSPRFRCHLRFRHCCLSQPGRRRRNSAFPPPRQEDAS